MPSTSSRQSSGYRVNGHFPSINGPHHYIDGLTIDSIGQLLIRRESLALGANILC
jgi:hypothetical protein